MRRHLNTFKTQLASPSARKMRRKLDTSKTKLASPNKRKIPKGTRNVPI
jgi:hypothetical protein